MIIQICSILGMSMATHSCNGRNAPCSHLTFTEPGSYDLRLVVEDDDGASKVKSPFIVLISETVSPDTFNAKAMFLSVSIIVLLLFVTGFIVQFIKASFGSNDGSEVDRQSDHSEQSTEYDEIRSVRISMQLLNTVELFALS